ncbi:hypothetical protein A2U01_0006133 [Trifolium medium]|uniref:Uncharacterized protein n=1 Tax=Trifolium medium TaxID=97028 RepID=A0A392ME15_9FABA|nr:hypothetical protein [Trifolium medium]
METAVIKGTQTPKFPKDTNRKTMPKHRPKSTTVSTWGSLKEKTPLTSKKHSKTPTTSKEHPRLNPLLEEPASLTRQGHPIYNGSPLPKIREEREKNAELSWAPAQKGELTPVLYLRGSPLPPISPKHGDIHANKRVTHYSSKKLLSYTDVNKLQGGRMKPSTTGSNKIIDPSTETSTQTKPCQRAR